MPPKKDAAAGAALLTGFTDKETKLLAAAFVSTLSADKVSTCLSRCGTGRIPASYSQVSVCKRFRMPHHANISQYDYDIFAAETGNTAGSLKKMCKYPQHARCSHDTY